MEEHGSETQCYGTWGLGEDDETIACPLPPVHVICVTHTGKPEEAVVVKVHCCNEHYENVANKGFVDSDRRD